MADNLDLKLAATPRKTEAPLTKQDTPMLKRKANTTEWAKIKGRKEKIRKSFENMKSFSAAADGEHARYCNHGPANKDFQCFYVTETDIDTCRTVVKDATNISKVDGDKVIRLLIGTVQVKMSAQSKLNNVRRRRKTAALNPGMKCCYCSGLSEEVQSQIPVHSVFTKNMCPRYDEGVAFAENLMSEKKSTTSTYYLPSTADGNRNVVCREFFSHALGLSKYKIDKIRNTEYHEFTSGMDKRTSNPGRPKIVVGDLKEQLKEHLKFYERSSHITQMLTMKKILDMFMILP